MAKQSSINMETISEEPSEIPPPISFSSSVLVAKAAKRRRSTNRSISFRTRRSSLNLEMCMYKDSVSAVTLAAKGRLDELKTLIKEHTMTLSEVDKDGRTLLHHAALHSQELVMSFLINSGSNLDAADNKGNTALHLAAENDLPEACHHLLANGANDSILNKDLYTPLHLAVQGKNKALQAILDHPVEYSSAGYCSKTPLHIICENDNIEAMIIFENKVLVNLPDAEKKNALKIFKTDDSGLTPIHLAARKNSHRVLNYLIQKCTQYGYTMEEVFGFLDEDNTTPLHAAVDSCNTEVVEVLLKHGASPVDSKGDLIPPLHLACSQGRSDMVKMMVEHTGPQIISSTDQQQKTPLHHCTLSIHSSCMIPYLVERGKGIINVDAHDVRGRTPLHNAVTSANLAGTKELISYQANPLAADKKGMNALHLALKSNRKGIVNALLELSCAPELISHTCSKGYSAIHHALHTGHGEMIPKMIAALRYEVQRIQDEEGNNYLHIAAAQGDVKALKALLDVSEIHKLLNEPNNCGMTPLHSAATGGHSQCINLLLNDGAMFHKALNGETAFMIACKKGFTSCAQLLLQSHPCQITMTDDRGNSALHAAALSRTASMITLILDRQCKLSINSESSSFLDMLIDCGDLDCVIAVINHDRWQECLDFRSPVRSSPVSGLIEQMPKAAKAVLDRCHSRATLDKSHPDYWESFDFKYLYCQKLRKSKIHPGSLFAMNLSMYPEADDITETTVKYKGNVQRTSSLDQSTVSKTRVSYGRQTMKILQKMKQFKRQALLTHPVVNAFLESKWRRYGNIYYFSMYAFQALIVGLLSVFVLIVPNTLQVLASFNETAAQTVNLDELFALKPGPQAIRAVVLLLNSIYLIYLLFNFVMFIKRRGGLSPFLQATVWVNLLTVIFIYAFLGFPNPIAAWPVGAFSCFFAWLSLLLSLEHLSLAGTIVKMFLEVAKTVFLVLCVSIFLLIAFAFAFYILAGSLSEFDNVGYAFLSVFGFMLGELPYDMYIRQESAGYLAFGKIFLVFMMFLAILLSIVLANLLIGLAVGDIERVKLNAILQRKDIEVEFFSQLDASIPRGSLKRFSLPLYTVYPNKNRSIWSLWRDSWKWIEAQIEPEQSDNSSAAGVAAYAYVSEITELKHHVLELKESMQQMQEANAEFRRRYRGLSATSMNSVSMDFDPAEELNESWNNGKSC
ncbi:transient receptor potential cation channel subfamily A member 1-like [Halichondria panicea]|uniref:transient receptor potential cation channel subfamily A member 1-like n=1 Tax=Halichondria panicea TaxID=6063 RepID=UPI00312B399D